jgi:hypothetical protein
MCYYRGWSSVRTLIVEYPPQPEPVQPLEISPESSGPAASQKTPDLPRFIIRIYWLTIRF